jgi:hypothetical protein
MFQPSILGRKEEGGETQGCQLLLSDRIIAEAIQQSRQQAEPKTKFCSFVTCFTSESRIPPGLRTSIIVYLNNVII